MDLSQQALISQGYNYLPVYRKIVADTHTPLSIYLKLANKPFSYLFESVEQGQKWGRYSIIGLSANKIIKVFGHQVKVYDHGQCVESVEVDDPLTWIETFKSQYQVPTDKNLPNFYGGLVGYFGYETIAYIEPKLAPVLDKLDELALPDILLMVSSELVVFDNLEQQAFLITYIDSQTQTYQQANQRLDELISALNQPLKLSKVNSVVGEFSSKIGKDKYCQMVDKIKQYIIAGDVMQVVPSQRLSCEFKAPAINLYRALRKLNPSPYMYFLNLDDFYIVGSSPEILTRLECNDNDEKTATVRPLAGTRKRGSTPAEDDALAKELLEDEKEIAEHLMLIDLGRNDLGRIAQIDSVNVSEKMAIEYYSHVMHIVSNVTCKLKKDVSVLDVLRATFPAGTLSGAPKIRAMEIIAQLEPVKRGVYSGAVGYLSWQGGMDLAIAIRTGIIKNDTLFVQAGAGIVYDSNAVLEWEETMHKSQALIKAAQSVCQY